MSFADHITKNMSGSAGSTNYLDKLKAIELPLGIAPIPFLISVVLTLLFLIGFFTFGALNSAKVINEHTETLAFTSVYIEESVREGEVIAALPEENTPSLPKQEITPTKVSPPKIKSGDVYEQQEDGTLMPVVTPDGTSVFSKYQKKSVIPQSLASDTTAPKISIVMTNAGLVSDRLTMLYQSLPPVISIGFSPYTNDLEAKTREAFANGFENWLMFPNETDKFPLEDPGTLVFLRNVNPSQNEERLNKLATAAPYLIGLVGIPNGVGLYAEQEKRTFLSFLKKTGMGYIHDRGYLSLSEEMDEYAVPFGEAQVIIDDVPTQENIQENLSRLISLAKSDGRVIAYIEGYPVTIKEIAAWVKTLEDEGVKLVPASQNLE